MRLLSLKKWFTFLLCVHSLFSYQPIWASSCSNYITSKDIVNDAKLLSWLQEKYISLSNNYKMPGGQYSESCSLIAFEIAELLIQAGASPLIGTYRGLEIRERNFFGNEALVPLRYSGRVIWGAHVVAIYNGYVYDPMLIQPARLEDYPLLAFGTKEVELRIQADMDYIKDRIRNKGY